MIPKNDVMGQSDAPVSINTPESPAESIPAESTEGEIISEPTVETEETPQEEPTEEATEETPEEPKEETEEDLEALATETPNDTALVKRLRSVLKNKLEPTLSQTQQEAIELVNELYGFDTESGTATTKGFAQKLAQKDINLAAQAYRDLATVSMNETGWTLGHQFLQDIGLDPFKIEELRQFSRGEITPQEVGIETIPENIPKEYAEAYKSLSTVNRTDIDIYLESGDDSRKHAALEILRDRQAKLDNQRLESEREQLSAQTFNQEVVGEVENQVNMTYTTLLDSIKTNPAYQQVKISSNAKVDSMVKDSIISQITALGDPNPVLAQQALRNFEAQGVKIDTKQISELMQTIERNIDIAVRAEKMGKLQRRDYSVQIQEAKNRIADAKGKALALSNKYFSQTLASITGKVPATPNPKGGLPNLEGESKGPEPTPKKQGVMSFKELDAQIMKTATAIQKGN